MKVLFLHREPGLASTRVRVLALVPWLEGRGIACETSRLPRSAPALRGLLARSDADVVVLQKKPPNAIAGLAWRARRAPLVFDFDDALPFRQSPRGGRYESATRRRRFDRAVRLADAFACGNEYLASLCRAPAKPVLVAPSAVPVDVPGARPFAGSGPARIGWIGAPHNFPELSLLGPALRALGRDRPLALVVISERRPDPAALGLEGVPIEHVPWRLDDQEREIARLDLGVMPLADSPWSRGKCAYKLLQYMAAGVPAVASPVGMNREVVSHAVNGLLARDDAGWQRALGELLDDPALARRLGAAGRETVRERYAYPVVAGLWHGFLERLVGR